MSGGAREEGALYVRPHVWKRVKGWGGGSLFSAVTSLRRVEPGGTVE